MFSRSTEIKRLLMKASDNSFRTVHRALKEVAHETGSNILNAQDVINRIIKIKGANS